MARFSDVSMMIVCIMVSLLLRVDPLMATSYLNDYEPRVFDHIPLNCYDCLSYRDIILTQLTDVPARSFTHFNLGSRDTFMILNGHLKLALHPYAFQSLIVQKPNKTLTITFAAPNSWLNITENTFHGLDLRSYSTLRIVIKFFYGCTFHKHSLSGIKMEPHSRLIIDVSSVTEIHLENQLAKENDFNSSVEFLISRTETILFDSYSFASLIVPSNQMLSFHFELISHIHFKPYAFQSLQLQAFSSVRFFAIFLMRLTIDSYAFQHMSVDSNATFNMTLRTLGTCLCFKSHSFDSLHTRLRSKHALIFFRFHGLRGLSFLTNTFSNLSLNHHENQLKILSTNPVNDPNTIVNFASQTFSTQSPGSILLNFSEVNVVRFEQQALATQQLSHQILFKDVALVDLSPIGYGGIQIRFQLTFDSIRHVKWSKEIPDSKGSETNSFNPDPSLVQYNFHALSNMSCVVYDAPRSVPWVFSVSNTTACNCPLLFAYKHGQLDGQSISCLNSMSGHETAKQMMLCDFDWLEKHCDDRIQSLTDLNGTHETSLGVFNSVELDHVLLRQLYDNNYLSCSHNYSILASSILVRSRLLDNLGLVLGIIFGVFILLLIVVMALLNGLQYKMREYDESWTWRRAMSLTTLRRTLSQTSLRRSRRDLRTLNGHGVVSKSDNQLDRLRAEQVDSDDPDVEHDLKKSQSIQDDFKKCPRFWTWTCFFVILVYCWFFFSFLELWQRSCSWP